MSWERSSLALQAGGLGRAFRQPERLDQGVGSRSERGEYREVHLLGGFHPIHLHVPHAVHGHILGTLPGQRSQYLELNFGTAVNPTLPRDVCSTHALEAEHRARGSVS